MEVLLLSVIGILLLIVFALSAKIYFLRRATQEIIDAIPDKLAADTNTLIDLSSRDPYMRRLASDINVQLRLLRRERHRYRQGDQELKEAITNISHDLRTPLTAICGYLDLLEREEINESARRYLSQIENRTEALKNLTEELLRYSVITSSPKLNPQRMDLVRALEESLLSFYGAMQEKGIQPQIVLPEEPVWCTLDTEGVNRIFSNIICNALKYSDGDFYVSMEKDGSITFSNTAQNLDAVTAGRLFDRFYTVETSRNATGLGLSIAKLLTERMGGTITAEYSNGRLCLRTRFMTGTVPDIDSCA